VTSDALRTVRANLDWLVTSKGAHYIAVVERNQPLLHAQLTVLPCRRCRPVASPARGGTAAPRPAPRRPPTSPAWTSRTPARPSRSTAGGRTPPSAGPPGRPSTPSPAWPALRATAGDLARLVREQWSIEAHHHVRDVTFREDASASGPANLATVRAAVTAALKDAEYLHIPEAAATTPPQRNLSPSMASSRTDTDIPRNTLEPWFPAAARRIRVALI